MNKTRWILSSAMILAALAAGPVEAAGRDRSNAMKNGPLCVQKISELEKAREKLAEKTLACKNALNKLQKVAIEISQNMELYKSSKKEDQDKLEKLEELREQLNDEYSEAQKAEDNMTIVVNNLEESVNSACGK